VKHKFLYQITNYLKLERAGQNRCQQPR